jgi:hypothetical protein
MGKGRYQKMFQWFKVYWTGLLVLSGRQRCACLIFGYLIELKLDSYSTIAILET